MAEARQPIHLLDVCNQKFSEFLFNAEHKHLVWLREIEEEAMKIFDRYRILQNGKRVEFLLPKVVN